MIRSDESNARESSISDCWKENPNCIALRVEPEEGGIFLLPYRHLAFSYFHSGEDGDELAIVFATHAVIFKGWRLGDLLAGLQKETVEWVRAIPGRYKTIQGPERVAVVSIRVDTYVREGRGEE